MSAVSICLLYPDLLGTYGDGGNAIVLAQRLSWRAIPNEVVPVTMGDEVPDSCDIYLLGGGEDQPQSAVADRLASSGALHRAVDRGAVIFAVCAGMQILGTRFAVAGDQSRSGLGLLDCETVRGNEPRRVGELAAHPEAEFALQPLTGYENHGGITKLGPNARRLATVFAGKGNDDGFGSEGLVCDRIIGTYLHGPALARNPTLADLLLRWVIASELDPVDDTEINNLRQERFAELESVRKRRRFRP